MESKNYWAKHHSKKSSPPKSYQAGSYLIGSNTGESDLSKSTQKRIKRQQTGRNIGAAAYGVVEGILDTLTFGLTDQLTDAGYEALSRGQSDTRKKQSDRYRVAGQVGGATTGAVLTGGATTGSAIGTTDIGTFANESSPQLEKGLNLAGTVAGMAKGSPSGSMEESPLKTLFNKQIGDRTILDILQSKSSFAGEGNALENLTGMTPTTKQSGGTVARTQVQANRGLKGQTNPSPFVIPKSYNTGSITTEGMKVPINIQAGNTVYKNVPPGINSIPVPKNADVVETPSYQAGSYMPKIEDTFSYGTPPQNTIQQMDEAGNEFSSSTVKPPRVININEILHKQAFAESSFNPTAVSPAGAVGLTQIMPNTLDYYIQKTKDTNVDPNNPEDAVKIQRWVIDNYYNKDFINKPNQSDEVRWAKTLAAYNMGPNGLLRFLEKQKEKGVDIYSDDMEWIEDLPKETKDYIHKILLNTNEDFNKGYESKKDSYRNLYFQSGGIKKYRLGGVRKYESGSSIDPPKEQSYLTNLYNTGKKYLSPVVSEISEKAQAFIADSRSSIENFGIKSAKDLTGAAFDAIVSPPKVDKETGKKAEPSFYDNWIYAPIRNMSTNVLPSNIVALKQSMEGIETPLENSFFPSSELKDIYLLVKRAKADGRNYVTYTDYNPAGNVMQQKSVSGYLGNQEKVRTTLGQFTFEEDPKTGVITVKDTYDFNPTTLDAHNVSKFTKEELSKKKPSELLDLGYNYYRKQGKNSTTAMYLATRYWVAPYHAKGNPPVKLILNPEDYKDVEADSSNQTTTANVGTNQKFQTGGGTSVYHSFQKPGFNMGLLDPEKQTLYVDRDDKGKERYQAYQDSLHLYNQGVHDLMFLEDEDYHFLAGILDPNDVQTTIGGYGKDKLESLKDKRYSLDFDGYDDFNDALTRLLILNDELPNHHILNIEDDKIGDEKTTYSANLFRKPIQPVKYKDVLVEKINPIKPSNNQIPERKLATPTVNIQQGRKKQPIMRSDNSGNQSSRGNRTGQYQVGERIWDGKQWVESRWDEEEVQQSARLARRSPRRTTYASFQTGGEKISDYFEEGFNPRTDVTYDRTTPGARNMYYNPELGKFLAQTTLPEATIETSLPRDEQGNIVFTGPEQKDNYYAFKNLGEEGLRQVRDMKSGIRRATGDFARTYLKPATMAATVPLTGVTGLAGTVGRGTQLVNWAMKSPIANVPGLTGWNLLNAAGAGYSVDQVVNPTSDTNKAIRQAVENPNATTVTDAAAEVVGTGLGFTGIGLSKGAKLNLQNIGKKLMGKIGKNTSGVGKVGSSVDDVGRGLTQTPQPWQMQELPGLHLKSTMSGSPLEKQLSKTGEISKNNIIAHINKAETSAADKFTLQKVLDQKFPNQNKIDYNDFRKAVSDEAIELERKVVADYQHNNWGLDRLGYPNAKRSTYDFSIKSGQHTIQELERKLSGAIEPTSWETSDQIRKNLEIQLSEAKAQLAKNLSEYEKLPLENVSVTYGNPTKFGRGNAKHFEEHTLGHARTLVSPEEPNIMHFLEQQSDWWQNLEKTKPINLEKYKEVLTRQEARYLEDLETLKKLKETKMDYAGNPKSDWEIAQFEDIVNKKGAELNMRKGDIFNPQQKKFLGKAHQERLLQENVKYAAEQGKSSVRFPTSETAAKVQGYSKRPPAQGTAREQELLSEINKSKKALSENPLPETKKVLEKRIKTFEHALKGGYDLEHQTILKKYAEQPKTIKKLFGKEPTIVTDSKGNTWYEFDIPDKFKQGKGEIKAFNWAVPTTIGAAAAASQASQQTYKHGGPVSYVPKKL